MCEGEGEEGGSGSSDPTAPRPVSQAGETQAHVGAPPPLRSRHVLEMFITDALACFTFTSNRDVRRIGHREGTQRQCAWHRPISIGYRVRAVPVRPVPPVTSSARPAPFACNR